MKKDFREVLKDLTLSGKLLSGNVETENVTQKNNTKRNIKMQKTEKAPVNLTKGVEPKAETQTPKHNPKNQQKNQTLHGKEKFHHAPGYQEIRDASELVLITGGDQEYLDSLSAILQNHKSNRFKLYDFIVKIDNLEEFEKACTLLIPCLDKKITEKDLNKTMDLLRAFKDAYEQIPYSERFVPKGDEKTPVKGVGSFAAFDIFDIFYRKCLKTFGSSDPQSQDLFLKNKNALNNFLNGIYNSWTQKILDEVFEYYWEQKKEELGIFFSCLHKKRAVALATFHANGIFKKSKKEFPVYLKCLPFSIRKEVKVTATP